MNRENVKKMVKAVAENMGCSECPFYDGCNLDPDKNTADDCRNHLEKVVGLID